MIARISNFLIHTSLSRRITIIVAGISCAMLTVASLVIYLALLRVIESQDQYLIEAKASFVMPHIMAGNADDIRNLLSSRYPQDLPKRLYVAVYDSTGKCVGRTFNTDASSLSGIFPAEATPFSTLVIGTATTESIESQDGRSFTVSTRAYQDQYGKKWIARISVDHDAEVYLGGAFEIAMTVILLVAFIIVPLTSGLVSKLITRPLSAIERNLSKTIPGEFYPIIDESKFPVELRALIATFNSLGREAQNAFQRLQSFSSDISHELRNPLNSMRMNLELLLSRQRTVADYKESIGSFLEDTIRISGLIESLLFLLRGERQLLTGELTGVDLLTMLSGIEEMFKPMVEEQGGSLSIACASHLNIMGEPRLLQRAVVNLVENAIKYGKPASSLAQKITIVAKSSELDPDAYEIAVHDNGPGVPDDELPFVFDRLFRSDRSRNSSGYGLGLAIVRMIVELHGGSVSVRKTSDGGNAFVLLMPKHLRKARIASSHSR